MSDESNPPGSEEKLRQLEEQIAFLERELEHQKEQIGDLWAELDVTRKTIARLASTLEAQSEEADGE